MIDIKQMIIDGNRRLLEGDAELLIRACDESNAINIVEIGSFDGGSTNVLGTWAKNNGAKLYSIEPLPTAKWKANIEKYGLQNYVELIQDISPKAAYDKRLPDTIDILFIDGDHRTCHTITDFIAFSPLLKVGGIWIQHDWCGRASNHYNNIPVRDMIKRAVDIIIEEYPGCFKEMGRSEGPDRGAIAFKKIADMKMNIK